MVPGYYEGDGIDGDLVIQNCLLFRRYDNDNRNEMHNDTDKCGLPFSWQDDDAWFYLRRGWLSWRQWLRWIKMTMTKWVYGSIVYWTLVLLMDYM